MYINHLLKFHGTINSIHEALIDMALDPRLMPGVAAGLRTVRTSASTPSLRLREGSDPPMMAMDNPGGNVRVVVRVRGFLPRGNLGSLQIGYRFANCWEQKLREARNVL
jgi:hypothetical protein